MGRHLHYQADRLNADFNVRPVSFRHTLHTSPLFNLDLLAEAAEHLFRDNGKANVYCMQSAARRDQNFNENLADRVDLGAMVRGIADNGSWIVLKRLERFAPFADLVAEARADFEEHIPEFRSGVAHQVHGYAFISSPGTITPYHIDGEWSLLAQVRGRKRYRIYDVTDPRVMPPAEIEAFHHGDFDAATHAPFKDQTAQDFLLEPGSALTQPRHAPHNVEVDPAGGYSITFGMSLLTDAWANEKPVHYANRVLRRWGARPCPLGEDPGLDAVKGAAYRAVSKACRIAGLPEPGGPEAEKRRTATRRGEASEPRFSYERKIG